MTIRFCKLQLADGTGRFFAVNPKAVRAIVPSHDDDRGGKRCLLVYGDENASVDVAGTVEQIVKDLSRSEEELHADWTLG